jgi:hypothetical protein
MKREIIEIADIAKATNGNFYRVVTLGETIKGDLVIKQKNVAVFGTEDFLKKIKKGMHLLDE